MSCFAGKMRGGKTPSDVEREIIARAREELAKVCEMFLPNNVFRRDVFGGIIENLGLNKVREQRLGVRPSKITVAEKFLLSKRKAWTAISVEQLKSDGLIADSSLKTGNASHTLDLLFQFK